MIVHILLFNDSSVVRLKEYTEIQKSFLFLHIRKNTSLVRALNYFEKPKKGICKKATQLSLIDAVNR